MSGATDELLIKRTLNGSESAFEALMNRYMNIIYSYISLKAPASDTEDILQETMLGAWRGLPDFDRSSSLKTWLLAIARRKLCDFYRSRKPVLPFPETEDEAFDVPSDEDVAAKAVGRLDVRSAIASLSSVERELTFMIFEAGLTYAQISEVTGIAVGTVKSRMSAVRTKLKRLLGDDYNEL